MNLTDTLWYCVAYYPELRDKSEVATDIANMKKLGINCVRMGEFAWHFMEPKPGKTDVSFFVDVANELYKNGIYTIMCTPTPTPPMWLTHNHPERLSVNASGVRCIAGARQHVCTNNPYMRRRSAIITKALAAAFAGNPAVIGWQLDNELKAQTAECMCPACKKLWHKWLKNKYKTVDALNKAWGTEIWSQYYDSFEQVLQPLDTVYAHNPSLSTEYRRFSRDMICEFAHEQAKILHSYGCAPITTDVHPGFALDTEPLFTKLDFTATNIYSMDNDYATWLMAFDMYRNIKDDNRFFVTETCPSFAGNVHMLMRPHKKGFMLAEALGTWASGGTGFSFWHFRQHRTGCELPHGALLSAWNTPAVGYDEASEIGRLRTKIDKYLAGATHRRAQTAVTYSEQARVYHLTEPLLEGADYTAHLKRITTLMQNAGLPRELIPEHGSLAGIKLIITPLLPYLSPEYIEKCKTVAQNGGVWLIGPGSGTRDEYHCNHADACFGAVEGLAGIKGEYLHPLGDTGACGGFNGISAPLSLQGAALLPQNGTQVLGTVSGGLIDGKAFFTVKKHGMGYIAFLSAMPKWGDGDALYAEIIKYAANLAGVNDCFAAENGTAVFAMVDKHGRDITVALNYDGNGGSYALAQNGTQILTDDDAPAGKRSLVPFGYEIVLH